ncbi:hypothetical protein CPB84DRAFT_1962230 [Gymnopilus junonius]|uniref:F-box domain-containing protein n=1 Tax=Gymnopilus junonius TaxID=109634 RepID=A0A9P5NN18_GYMJU|nr:hypothetical protein CPB84DRAFT_1962230 [Gymnopilus junonius]
MYGSTVELPNELWLRIAQFIPDADLYRLASVNHLFHDSAEDRMYRDLVLDDDRPQVLMRKLTKLQNNPATSRRVRSLEMHPRAIRSACLKSQSQSVPQKTTKNHFFTSNHPLPNPPQRPLQPAHTHRIIHHLLALPLFSPGRNSILHPPPHLPMVDYQRRAKYEEAELDMRLEGVVELLQCIPSGLKFERLEMLVLGFNAENENDGFGVGQDIMMPPLPLGLVVNDNYSSRRSPTTVLTPESNPAPLNSSPNASSNTPNTQTFLHLAEFILSLSDTLTSFTLSLPPSSTSIPRQRMIFFTL